MMRHTVFLGKLSVDLLFVFHPTCLHSVPVEEGLTGPRSLTRAILKNKGLTPQRPKAIRNPRVKKRQKFEKAKRKVSSQKALYKGGLSETKGRYEGEKSGISKVVKSIRLG
jgi:U3 small nucleolar RNA-associated protein 3